MKRCCVIMVILALGFLPAVGCGKRKPAKPRLGEVERLPRVETIVLGKAAKLEVVRTYTATVDSLEKAELCAMVRGVIKTMPADLDIGRVIKKGEVLLTLAVPDLDADLKNKAALVEQNDKAEALALQAVEVAKAEVKEAQAMVLRSDSEQEFRLAQYTRITKLAQGDTLSKQQMDEAKLQLGAAQAALAAAHAQVATKQSRHLAAEKERALAAARLNTARTDLTKTEVQVDFASIRAPFDGVITKRWVNTGAAIRDPGMPIFTVMRSDKLRVILDVPERDVPYFHTQPQGNPVQVRIPALMDAGNDKFAGTITLLSGAIDPVTRTMRAEMHVDNVLGAKPGALQPEMTGTASVVLTTRDAITVPSSALVRSGSKMEIYIVADAAGEPLKGVVKRVEVQTGLDDGLRVEIKSDVLTGAELVIARGAGMLRPGDNVIAAAKQGD